MKGLKRMKKQEQKVAQMVKKSSWLILKHGSETFLIEMKM